MLVLVPRYYSIRYHKKVPVMVLHKCRGDSKSVNVLTISTISLSTVVFG